ncbi:phospholipase D-like domain-containing protein [Clostridium perfringens]|nr:phospholipase D-like domain-containing protein [Clostridium perfringens]ELC8455654.1 DUF1669 domain-containing protein [Clostridium perfringens]TGY46742.1 DUF1669 domain-containing protein [Clostridium perfringens]
MKLDGFSLDKLVDIINGDERLKKGLIYRSGPDLVKFFGEFGFREIYNEIFTGFKMSRKKYTLSKLNELNGTKKMEKVILKLVDNRNFIGLEFDYEPVNNSKTIEKINTIIKYDGYEIKLDENNKCFISGDILPDEESVELEIKFEDIEKMIIDEIDKAKYIIHIAMAWFTNKKIYNALLAKKNQGVTIKLVVLDDEINKKQGLNYDVFETYKMKKFGLYKSNLMHHKFCVIDLKVVLTGSYNWTNAAEFNKENCNKILGREVVETYADKFNDLREEVELDELLF